MNKKFIKECDEQLKNNSDKGDWDKWNPNIKELTQELCWHVAKLNKALLLSELGGISEYSADVANICEKAFNQSKTAESNRKPSYDCYGDFIGWSYKKGIGFNVDEDI